METPVKGSHGLVFLLHANMNAMRITTAELAEKSGVGKSRIESWWGGTVPEIDALDKVFLVLGFYIKLSQTKPTVHKADRIHTYKVIMCACGCGGRVPQQKYIHGYKKMLRHA